MNKQDAINAAYVATACTQRATIANMWADRLAELNNPKLDELEEELRTNAEVFYLIAANATTLSRTVQNGDRHD